MIGEMLEALGEAATSIYAWPARNDGRWRRVYWVFAAIVLMLLIGSVFLMAR
jgi:hypothetical protein